MKISKERFFTTLAIIIYIFLIYHAFKNIANIFHDIEGYNYHKISIINFIFGSIILILLSFFLPLKSEKPSSVIIWFVYFFHFIPSILFFDTIIKDSDIFVYYVISIFLSILIITYPLGRGKIKFYSNKNLSYLIIISFFSFYFFSLFLFYKDFGFKFSIPSIFDVYGVRDEYKSSVSTFGGYASIWGGYLFSPFLIIMCLLYFKRKKLLPSAFLFFLAFFFSYQVFAAAGFKSVAFMFLVVFAYYIFLTLFPKINIGSGITYILLSILILSFFLSYVFNFNDLLLHWVRRSLIIPGINSAYFYEYETLIGFKDHEHAPHIISTFYYGADGSANTGLIGDGVKRFGLYFFWLNIIFFGIVLKLIDFFTGIKSRFFLPLFIPASYAFSNSSITSALLTYGIFFMVIFVFAIRRIKEYE